MLLAGCSTPTSASQTDTQTAKSDGKDTVVSELETDQTPVDIAAQDETATETTVEPEECPGATTGTKLFVNGQHGYCLLYPQGQNVEESLDKDRLYLSINVGETGVPQGIVYIAVDNTDGRTASQAADEFVSRLSEDWAAAIERTTVTIDGETAVVLNNVGGQNPQRYVYFVHNDLLYEMNIALMDEESGDCCGELEDFYSTMVTSLTFLPEATMPIEAEPTEEPVSEPTEEPVPEPTSIAPTATLPTASTPTPAPSWSPPEHVDQAMTVSGEPGTVQQFSASLPSEDGLTSHAIQITVDIPAADGNAGRRLVEYSVTCAGTGSDSLRWDFWGWPPVELTCGDTKKSEGLKWDYNVVYFVVEVPADSIASVTYTFSVKVDEYTW